MASRSRLSPRKDKARKPTWLDIAVTGKARAAIRRALREEDRARFIKLGRELARAAFEHVGRKATDKALATAARAMRFDDRNDLLARLGSAEITGRDVVSAVYPQLLPKEGVEVDAKRAVIGLSPDQSLSGPFAASRCRVSASSALPSRAGRRGPRHRL